MSEQAMWQHLKQRLGPYFQAERITERLNDGVPDVSYQYKLADGIAGWLELKYVERLGKDSSVVRIPWKSAAQPAWLNRWARSRGFAGVLLRVGQVSWHYWRARPDIAWVAKMQQPVDLASADWRHFGATVDVHGLTKALVTYSDAYR